MLDVRLGPIWRLCLVVVAPLVLLAMVANHLWHLELAEYEGRLLPWGAQGGIWTRCASFREDEKANSTIRERDICF